jgi:hypothetical protein
LHRGAVHTQSCLGAKKHDAVQQGVVGARNERYETSPSNDRPHYALMLAARITLGHLRVNRCRGAPSASAAAFRVREDNIDLPVELVDDFGGRVPGRADPRGGACVVARHEIRHTFSGLPEPHIVHKPNTNSMV